MNGMMKCSLNCDTGNASGAVMIVPRLNYSAMLLSEVICDLRSERIKIKAANRVLAKTSPDGKELCDAIAVERTMVFSMDTLLRIQRRLESISGVADIPKVMLPAIPAIRTISAQLHSLMPSCSRQLCELSVHLGSVVLDSATISTAKFDFSRTNYESATFLDEVKLMADSKINKQYRNLDSLQ